ncbi:MAG: hypothetical protein U0R64_09020, partial [Candidatus Nanopelagicales bacterium]
MPESRLPILAAAVVVLVAGCSGSPPSTGPTASSPALARVDRLATQVPHQLRTDGILTIGTDPSYPPMEFVSRSGTAVEGADIDLAGAVSTVLG